MAKVQDEDRREFARRCQLLTFVGCWTLAGQLLRWHVLSSDHQWKRSEFVLSTAVIRKYECWPLEQLDSFECLEQPAFIESSIRDIWDTKKCTSPFSNQKQDHNEDGLLILSTKVRPPHSLNFSITSSLTLQGRKEEIRHGNADAVRNHRAMHFWYINWFANPKNSNHSRKMHDS